MAIELQELRQWYHSESREMAERDLTSAVDWHKEHRAGKGYKLDCLCRMAELLVDKGLLTSEEVLTVFNLESEWEVKQ